MIRRLTAGLLCLLMIAFLLPQQASALNAAYTTGPEIYGEAYCVMNADTGEIICGRNAMGKYYPASITKIMTALIVLENVDDLSATVTFSETAIKPCTSHSSTLTPIAEVGEQMSVWDCLCGMIMVSGNECANALAEYVAGSNEEFAELMNAKAEELGCTNTHFVDPHGLHDAQHYTNPYDMCLIMRAALQNELFVKLDSQQSYTIQATNKCAARQLAMGHQMVVGAITYDGVFAGKTGRTPQAGRTLVTAAKHDGSTIITVVMKSDDDHHYTDTEILLDYAYEKLDNGEFLTPAGETSANIEPVSEKDADTTSEVNSGAESVTSDGTETGLTEAVSADDSEAESELQSAGEISSETTAASPAGSESSGKQGTAGGFSFGEFFRKIGNSVAGVVKNIGTVCSNAFDNLDFDIAAMVLMVIAGAAIIFGVAVMIWSGGRKRRRRRRREQLRRKHMKERRLREKRMRERRMRASRVHNRHSDGDEMSDGGDE